jgi:hypothetical protein
MATTADVDTAFKNAGKGTPSASDYQLYTSNPFFTDAGRVEGDVRAGGGGSTANDAAGKQSIQQYLDTYQQTLATTFGGNIATKVNNGEQVGFSDIASELKPAGGAPALLDRQQMFADYRQSYGVDKLEATMNDLKAQQDDLVAQARINVNAERGKQVATNVIEGRVTEQQRTAQENLDFIQRQISRTNDQLTTAYNVIGMYMNFANLDYQDAVSKYNTEFQQNLDTINLVRGVASDARDVVRLGNEGKRLQMDETRLQSDLQQRNIDNARANLQVYTNAITNGNLDVKNLSPDMVSQLNKLEVQSGLPVGFVQNLQLDAKSRIAFTTTNNGITQVGIIGADGNIAVKSYGTYQATAGDKSKVEKSNLISALNSQTGADGYVSPATYRTLLNTYIARGGTSDDFISNTKQFVNPNHPNDYGVPDSTINPDKYKKDQSQGDALSKLVNGQY